MDDRDFLNDRGLPVSRFPRFTTRPSVFWTRHQDRTGVASRGAVCGDLEFGEWTFTFSNWSGRGSREDTPESIPNKPLLSSGETDLSLPTISGSPVPQGVSIPPLMLTWFSRTLGLSPRTSGEKPNVPEREVRR